MTEIKPCPFCGGEAHFETSFSGGPYVLYDECGAATMFADDEDGAAAFWHRRTPDPPLLNGLREARDALVDASLFVELVRAHWENRGDQEQVEEAVDCLRQSNAVIANLDTLLSEGGQ